MKKIFLNQIFVIYTRYLIGGAFVFASLIKLKGHRFTLESGENNPIDSAWHFFETMYQSGIYWQFIGLAQLIAGFLLMTQRHAKLGAIINFPIIANIFVITISYDFRGTPVITGLMLLANLMLLIWDWDTLKVIFNYAPSIEDKSRIEKDVVWEIVGLALFSFTFLYRVFVFKYDLIFWLGVCLLIGSIGLFLGFKRRARY